MLELDYLKSKQETDIDIHGDKSVINKITNFWNLMVDTATAKHTIEHIDTDSKWEHGYCYS